MLGKFSINVHDASELSTSMSPTPSSGVKMSKRDRDGGRQEGPVGVSRGLNGSQGGGRREYGFDVGTEGNGTCGGKERGPTEKNGTTDIESPT